MQWPSLKLMATDQQWVNLAQIEHYAVVCAYPMTGRADEPLPENWDDIPDARGCTPQSCSFRVHYAALQQLNAQVFGLSMQVSAYQLEAQQRLHLPFELLSKNDLRLKAELSLPTLEVAYMELYKRMTLIIK